MCFTPYVSLSTFIIEFCIALFFILENPKDKLNRMIALLALLLGLYQLNEFLICTTGVLVFTKLAMIVTALLPALAVSYALVMWRAKLKYYWHLLIYSPAVFFIVMFSTLYYKETAACHTVFIEYPGIGLLGKFYALYYLIYIIAAYLLFYFASHSVRSKHEKVLLTMGKFGMLLFTVPAFIFIIFMPSFYAQFPSVLCEFALLLAIELIVILWYKDKHKIRY